jgi:hypothetical protein
MLDETLSEFLQQGLAIHLGTRNERLEPNGVRVTAVKVEDDREHLIVYVPTAASPAFMRDLETNGQAAVSFARPVDDKAYQVKGVFVSSRETTAAEQDFVAGQWQQALGQLDKVGLPGSSMATWKVWPCVAVRIRVTALFDQTPGPYAGAAIK